MPKPNYIYTARVVDVHDGDTVTVLVDHGFEPILSERNFRMLGIDTPELRGPTKQYGLIARDALKYLIGSANKVIVQSVKPDKFGGRWLANLWRPDDEVTLSQHMINHRFARAYGGEAKTDYPVAAYPIQPVDYDFAAAAPKTGGWAGIFSL